MKNVQERLYERKEKAADRTHLTEFFTSIVTGHFDVMTNKKKIKNKKSSGRKKQNCEESSSSSSRSEHHSSCESKTHNYHSDNSRGGTPYCVFTHSAD